MNTSGLSCLEFNVLILEDENKLKETYKRAGLVLAEGADEREQHASTTGTLIDISPTAFTYEKFPDGYELPKVGSKVVYAKYAGTRVTGKDGKDYRIVKDKDVLAVFSA